MAKWILLNEVIIGAVTAGAGGGPVKHFPGDPIDDAQLPTAPIIAGGGILWPASDPIMAAAAAIVLSLKQRGSGQSPKLTENLLAAAFFSLMGGTGGQLLGPAGVGAGQIAGLVQKATVSVGFANMSAAATTQAFNLSPSLPANARILGRSLRIATAFSGGAISAMTLSLGVAGATTDIINAQSVFTGTTGNIQGTTGGNPFAFYAAAGPLQALFTATGANVNAATAGALVVDAYYTVLP